MRLLPSLLLLLPLLACSSTAPDQHYARALGMERQLLRSYPDADYGHSGYIAVLRELKAVPSSAPEHGRAQKLVSTISDGRRHAAKEAYPQIDHLPKRLEGSEAPVPSRPATRATTSTRSAPASRGAKSSSLSDLSPEQKQRLDITMYSTSWCGYCKKARRWLNANELPFVEKDVEKDPAGAREFQELTGGRGGVPVITVGKDVIRGFSERRLEIAIERAARGG